MGLKVVVVEGDDVFDVVLCGVFCFEELGDVVVVYCDCIVFVNVYLGVVLIVDVFVVGVDVVLIGCVVDLLLFVVLLIYVFGWWMDDWDWFG